MRSFTSIQSFLTHLARLPGELHAAERHGEQVAGEMLVEHAKALIGAEQ